MKEFASRYEFGFCLEPSETSWIFEPPEGGGTVTLTPAGWVLDKGGVLMAPSWLCSANWDGWYKISFTTISAGQAYCAAWFYGYDKNEMGSSIYSAVDISHESYVQEFCYRGRWNADSWTIGFRCGKPCTIRNIVVEAIDAERAAQWGERVRSEIPPVNYTPPKIRAMTKLPKTMQYLSNGEPFRVTMLGDSLTHDTRNSNFDALLSRSYPESNFQVVMSARGSTGCWYYKDPEQFKVYVADTSPDLLIIGANPAHEKLDSIREVAQRAEAELGCEVAFLAPAFGPDWRDPMQAESDGTLPEQDWPSQSFLTGFEALARELDIAYIDMATPWNNYLGASKKPFNWFHRDLHHGNNRGMQAVASMLKQCLE